MKLRNILDPADLRESGWSDFHFGYRDRSLWRRFWYRRGWRLARKRTGWAWPLEDARP